MEISNFSNFSSAVASEEQTGKAVNRSNFSNFSNFSSAVASEEQTGKGTT